MRIRYLLGLLAFSVVPSALAAQGTCPSLPAGATVRLHTRAASTFTVPQATQPSDTVLSLTSAGGAGPLSVRCADVQRAQLRLGPARGRSAVRGIGIGLVTGAVLGAGLGYFGTESDDSGWEILSREDVAVIGAVFLGGTGAAAGGLIGYFAPSSRWEEVPVAPRPRHASAEGLRIAPAGASQVRVSYSIRL